MTRQRWFCSYCGALTSHPSFDGRFARCPAHSTLPREADLIPPDPLTTIPPMREEYGWNNDGIGCRRCFTFRMQCERPDCPGARNWQAAHAREDTSPTRGSGA